MLPHMELCSMLVFMSFFSFIFLGGGKEGKEICKTSLSLKHGISHMIFILQPACKQCTPH